MASMAAWAAPGSVRRLPGCCGTIGPVVWSSGSPGPRCSAGSRSFEPGWVVLVVHAARATTASAATARVRLGPVTGAEDMGLDGRPAAVDAEHLPGDVAARVGREEEERAVEL